MVGYLRKVPHLLALASDLDDGRTKNGICVYRVGGHRQILGESGVCEKNDRSAEMTACKVTPATPISMLDLMTSAFLALRKKRPFW